MRATKVYLNWIIGIVFTSLVLLVSGMLVHAQQDSIKLAISPQVLDLEANRGDTIESQFRLTNGSDETIIIEAIPKNFTPQGEEGGIDLTEDDTSYSIAKWITTEPSVVTIPPRKTQDFAVTMTIPDNAEPGSHFGSVVFATIPTQGQGSGAAVSQEIAPVILVTIAGELIESASIVEFSSLKSVWSSEPDAIFEARIKNNGNVHFKPTGVVEIFDMFNNSVAKVSLEGENVLPDSIRKNYATWPLDGFLIGKYRAELTMVYGEDDQISTAQTSFYIFPYQKILPAVAGIALLGVLAFRYSNRIRLALKILSGKHVDPPK